MERFHIIQPSALLAPYVKHYWLLESDDVVHSQRVIPTGNIEAALASIHANGGKTVRQKTKIETDGMGYFAQFSDSEGNTLGLYPEK